MFIAVDIQRIASRLDQFEAILKRSAGSHPLGIALGAGEQVAYSR